MNNNKQIKEQLEAMTASFKIASKSKESAIKFLKDAGIYQFLETVTPEKKTHLNSTIKK